MVPQKVYRKKFCDDDQGLNCSIQKLMSVCKDQVLSKIHRPINLKFGQNISMILGEVLKEKEFRKVPRPEQNLAGPRAVG